MIEVSKVLTSALLDLPVFDKGHDDVTARDDVICQIFLFWIISLIDILGSVQVSNQLDNF